MDAQQPNFDPKSSPRHCRASRPAAAIAACALAMTGSAAPANAAESVETKLVFADQPAGASVEGSAALFGRQFLWGGLDDRFSEDMNSQLQAACFDDGDRAGFLGPILGFLIGPLVNLATTHLKSQIDDELKKYGAEFKSAAQSPFYRVSAGVTKQNWRCFRVTRFRTVTPNPPAEGSRSSGAPPSTVTAVRTVDFDYLAQVLLVDAHGRPVDDAALAAGIKVRPLRVHLARPVAKGNKIGVAGTLTFDAVWRDGGEGKARAVFSGPTFEEKFKRVEPDGKSRWDRLGKDGATSNSPFYFLKSDPQAGDADKFIPLGNLQTHPLPPISSTPSPSATQVTVSFLGAEAGSGEGRGVLKAISKLLGAAQGDLNSAISKAAKKLVDPEEPTPPAKPEFYCGTFAGTPSGGSISWTKSDSACPSAPAESGG